MLEVVAARIEASMGRAPATVTADLADPTSVGEAVTDATARLGGLEILVNNAGTIVRAPSSDMSIEEWNRVVDVNLRGAFLASQSAFAALSSSRGSIVNIASLSAKFGIRRAAAYGASKGGIVQLTRALAIEWAADGVRVNAVAPGYVKTEFTRALQEDRERASSIEARIPMGRWATPEDIAGSVVFFCSDLAGYVTGQVLYVDGGYSCDG
jgi:NAD(P)-dependent dehydrogenase (short-subunit alcohol dehydrogenase family)